MIHLSRRMQALADMVDVGSRLCDVGCDHGYLPIYLMQAGVITSAIAMDIGKGPLQAARGHITACGLDETITTRLSDGLEQLQIGEADTISIAGMGGGLVIRILSAYPQVAKSMSSLILQPQSEIDLVRKFLQEQGYEFLAEDMVLEDGKFYPMMKVHYVGDTLMDQMMLTEAQAFFGPCLLEMKHPVLCQFLEREVRITKEVIQKLQAQQRTEAIAQRLSEKTAYLEICYEAIRITT